MTTGISAADRARTVQAAVANAKAEDIVSPGHIFPLMAQPGGVLARAGLPVTWRAWPGSRPAA